MVGHSEEFFVPKGAKKNPIEKKPAQITIVGDLLSGGSLVCGKEDLSYYDLTKTLKINSFADIKKNLDILKKVEDYRLQKLVEIFVQVTQEVPDEDTKKVVRNILEMSRHIDPERPQAALPPVTEEMVLSKYYFDLIKNEFKSELEEQA